jgi:hypothetical protein
MAGGRFRRLFGKKWQQKRGQPNGTYCLCNSPEPADMLSEKERRANWIVLTVCLLGGALLAFIGVRFFATPHAAARTFGVAAHSTGYELYHIIGLRNLWLGLLVVAFAIQRLWRALALWFAGAVVVCLADASIAAGSMGRSPQLAFHLACAIASLVLAVLCWRVARKTELVV